jgi:hypothetical protein
MKNSLPLAFGLLLPSLAFSQATITDSDMPDAGDSIRVSYAVSLGSADQTLTGANYVWDYSFLTPSAQERIEYITPTALPFNFLADVAVTNYSPDSLPFIGQLPTNFTDYYKNTSSSFRQVGITFDLPQLTSFSAPLIFSSSDYVYRFPLTYGDMDTCDAAYSLNIPGVGYIGQDRHRENHVDGWGMLITPLDTYQVVRVRSVLDMTDTVSIDTTNQTGYSLQRPTEVQYKWLAPGMKIPVLEIDCQIIQNAEVVTSIVYQDTLRDSLWQVSVMNHDANAPWVSVYPNPANETVYVQYAQNGQGDLQFVVNDLSGKTVISERQQNAHSGGIRQLDVSGLPAGIYLISVVSETGKTVSKLIIR